MTYASTEFLISLADAKSYLDVPSTDSAYDDIIGNMLNCIRTVFDNYCQRTLLNQAFSEIYDGTGDITLLLKNYPVTTAQSAILAYDDSDRVFGADTLIDADDFGLDSSRGILYNDAVWSKGYQNIKVCYEAGYTQASMPYDLRLACYEALGFFWKRRQDKSWGVTNKTIGDISISFETSMPASVKLILDKYRKIR